MEVKRKQTHKGNVKAQAFVIVDGRKAIYFFKKR